MAADDEISETNPVGYEIRRTGIGRFVRAVSAHAAVLTEREEPRPDDVYVVVEISDADGTGAVMISRAMAAHLVNTVNLSIIEANRLVEELS